MRSERSPDPIWPLPLWAGYDDELTSKDKIAAQVTRMMEDPRAHDVFAHFHEQWLHTSEIPNIEKDTKIFTTFTSDLVPLMAEETRRFLDSAVAALQRRPADQPGGGADGTIAEPPQPAVDGAPGDRAQAQVQAAAVLDVDVEAQRKA